MSEEFNMKSVSATDSKTINHLKSYPIVNDIYSWLAYSAILASVISNLKPFFTYVENLLLSIALVKLILVKFDEYFNNLVLDNVDALVPSLKQVHLQDIHPKELLNKAFSKVPFGGVNEKFKGYQKQFRPAVNTRVEPVIKPLNNKLETLIDAYLPKSSEASVSGAVPEYDDELTRLYNLGSSVYQKTVPVASSGISEMQTHILQTYSSKLPTAAEAEGAKNTAASPVEKIQAAAKASVVLSSEGVEFLNKTYENVKPKLGPYIEKAKDLSKNIGISPDNAKNKIDALLSEAANGAATATANGSANSEATI